jgi:uncharacterized membrane protein YeaQ/YmgE (transglycosylase-associated protein family)
LAFSVATTESLANLVRESTRIFETLHRRQQGALQKIGALVHFIWIILIGFAAGLVAKLLTPGSGPSGFFLTASLGIAGSLVASYLGQFTGLYPPGRSAGFIGAIIGAVVLLAAYHLVAKK